MRQLTNAECLFHVMRRCVIVHIADLDTTVNRSIHHIHTEQYMRSFW